MGDSGRIGATQQTAKPFLWLDLFNLPGNFHRVVIGWHILPEFPRRFKKQASWWTWFKPVGVFLTWNQWPYVYVLECSQGTGWAWIMDQNHISNTGPHGEPGASNGLCASHSVHPVACVDWEQGH